MGPAKPRYRDGDEAGARPLAAATDLHGAALLAGVAIAAATRPRWPSAPAPPDLA